MVYSKTHKILDIVLTTINAKWIHPSLALRLLKANLGELESKSEIIEFALRQPLKEKVETLAAALAGTAVDIVDAAADTAAVRTKVLGISVSIWNHTATLELLHELESVWEVSRQRPIVVLGGPEVSYLPQDAEIFKYANYIICGEGEIAFRELCESVFHNSMLPETKFINGTLVDLNALKSAYHFYTNEDLAGKLVYVESSRGCPFSCEFCLSAVEPSPATPRVRKFPLESFLAEMEDLIQRGAGTFKFLDRTFNSDIPRALRIIEFFLEKIEQRTYGEHSQGEHSCGGHARGEQQTCSPNNLVVHFEMAAALFSAELIEALSRFSPGSLRLEIGLQTLNTEVAALIGLPRKGRAFGNGEAVSPSSELETIRLLREKTHAIIHADLIAGLPGEDMASFGKGFDQLYTALAAGAKIQQAEIQQAEIQLGILKLLPGTPMVRHIETYGMKFNPKPPYDIEETAAMSTGDIQRIKNFARFWELIVNRYNYPFEHDTPGIFESFMQLSDSLFAHFGRNWGIDKQELLRYIIDKQ